MKFVMHRNRTIASLSGLSIEFKKGELTHVPPCMYDEVLAAGGVPETEIAEPDPGEGPVEPTDPVARQKAIFAAMETITLRGAREDFTAAGAPHAKALTKHLGWNVDNKERDKAWLAFKTKEDAS